MISNEQAVIAAVMLDARVFRFAVEECSPEDFADARFGGVFAGIIAMVAAGEPVDVLTVGARLPLWDVRGVGVAELHQWVSEVPTAANVGFYAAQVREASVRRQLQEVSVRLAQQSAQFEPGWALANAVTQLQQIRDGNLGQNVVAKPLRQILEGHDEYDWAIEGLLERRDRLLLTGVEGGGKSTLVRQFAIMAAAGLHPFTFERMVPTRVLVVDAENSELQWRRAVRPLVRMAAERGSLDPGDVAHLACIPRLDLTRDQDLGQVHRLIDTHQPDILFIGPLYRLIPRAINSDDDAAPLLAALDTLRARGPALVIEAHAGHSIGSGGERDLRPRGSAALLGWPEFGLGLRVDRQGSGDDFQLVRWRGDRDQRAWPSHLARHASEWPWTRTG